MKDRWPHLDKFRTQNPPYTSPAGATYGAFVIPFNSHDTIKLCVIATDGKDETIDTEWEHVSVHAFDTVFRQQRTPKWDEMDFIKKLFWNDDEIVMQLYVATKDHINIHEHVLHLWKPTKQTIPLPPKICV